MLLPHLLPFVVQALLPPDIHDGSDTSQIWIAVRDGNIHFMNQDYADPYFCSFIISGSDQLEKDFDVSQACSFLVVQAKKSCLSTLTSSAESYRCITIFSRGFST